MGKQKKKIVINREESDFKPRVGRIPIGKPPQSFRDKSKYSRRQKHKKGMDDSPYPFFYLTTYHLYVRLFFISHLTRYRIQ